MRRAVSRIVLVMWMFLFAGAAAAAPKEPAAPPKAKETVAGVYSIFQMDREVGSESFSKTVYDNNTVVFESKTIITLAQPDSIIETSFMTLEDDSYFLIDYASTRFAGKLRQSTGIEVYSNVAAIKTVTNGKENSQTRVLPAGALCIQSGTTYQLELYLQRYNDTAGGKQSILIFDPIGKKEYTKVLELMGQEETAVLGETKLYAAYALQGERGIEIKFFVDDSRRIVKAENPLQRMVFELSQKPQE